MLPLARAKLLRNLLICAGVALLAAVSSIEPVRAEVLRTGGTGAATGMIKQVGEAYTAQHPDVTIEVIGGLGSNGAIAATIDGALDFAIAGRPLKPEEAALPLSARVLVRTPFGLASSYPTPGNVASNDIAEMFTNPAGRWPDGTPIRVILRPKMEAESANLAAAYPKMVDAIAQLRRRAEIPVAITDRDNALLAENLAGSLTAFTLTQILTEKPNLHFLAIDGVEPTIENLERGSYPYRKDFNFVVATNRKAAIDQFLAFLISPECETILRASGNLAVRQ